MEDTLKDILLNVNEWLKFAEAKNAALIALNLGSIFGATTTITQSQHEIPQLILYYLYSFILLNGLGLFISLFSFWPQFHEETLGKKIEDIVFPKKLRVKPSLLYYGLIRDYDPDMYLAKLCEFCKKEVDKCSSLELDYANQIVISSKITFRKYIYFKAALICTISAMLTPVILILSALLFKTTDYIIMEQYKKSLVPLTIFIISSIIIWKLF
jgi:hypothetical protein